MRSATSSSLAFFSSLARSATAAALAFLSFSADLLSRGLRPSEARTLPGEQSLRRWPGLAADQG